MLDFSNLTVNFAGGKSTRPLDSGFRSAQQPKDKADDLNTGAPPLILVVEDEPGMRMIVTQCLVAQNYRVIEAENIADARAILMQEPIDLVLLDMILPDGDGMKFLKAIRSSISIPVIFVTQRDEIEDLVDGLNLGADDYITKPFRPSELIARVGAVLRRRGSQRIDETESVIDIDAYSLDTVQRTLSHDGEFLHKLTPQESIIMGMLARARGQTVSREELHKAIRRTAWRTDDRTVDVVVSRLRRLLADTGLTINSVHRVGYRLHAIDE